MLLIGAGIAGCAKSSDDASQKQVLKLSASAPLDTIDISKATGYGQTGNIFESFYRLGKDGKATPGLAKSGKVSKDGLTWTFKLRNAKWSNGDKITADDFVYSWRRSIDPKTESPYAYLFSGVKNADEIAAGKLSTDKLGIKALDKNTVQVELDKPIAYFKVLLAYPLFGPQNQKFIEKYGKKYATRSKYMVYSGPFKMTDWNGTSDKWNFVKNDQYWDKGSFKLKKITYKVVENTNTGYQLYSQDKLDMTPLSNQQVKSLKNNSEFKQYPYSYVSYLSYNFQAKDPTVKKAFTARVMEHQPPAAPGDYNQALMELGALVCVPNGAPLCDVCPLAGLCQARAAGTTAALPQKAKPKPRKVLPVTVALVESPAGFLVQQRPAKGLLAGLWQPLLWESEHLLQAEVLARLAALGVDTGTAVPEALPAAKHIFSHIEWLLSGVALTVPEQAAPAGCVWASREELRTTYTLPGAFAAYKDRMLG